MVRSTVLSIYFVLVLAFSRVECSNEDLSSNIAVSFAQNVADYLKENPNVKILHPLIKESLVDDPSPRVKLTYQTGKRVNGMNFYSFWN